MHEYRVFETDQFARDLKRIARAGHQDLVRKLRTVVYPQLTQHPHFGPHIRRLKHFTPETWRYRVGAWRFFYEIDEDEHTVFMVTAAHRGGVLVTTTETTVASVDRQTW